jgi:hypothetical protein
MALSICITSQLYPPLVVFITFKAELELTLINLEPKAQPVSLFIKHNELKCILEKVSGDQLAPSLVVLKIVESLHANPFVLLGNTIENKS